MVGAASINPAPPPGLRDAAFPSPFVTSLSLSLSLFTGGWAGGRLFKAARVSRSIHPSIHGPSCCSGGVLHLRGPVPKACSVAIPR